MLDRRREKRVKGELVREAEKIDREIGRDLGEYTRIKDELEGIERDKCRGAIVRSRAQYAMEGERCTSFFLGLEKSKQERNYLKQVEGKDGRKITDFVGIAERVEEFYRDLRLKLRGKVTVINGLIGSKLVYIMNVMEMPERVHKEIDTAINAFLWSGRGARIVREVMENEHKDGGMKLINLERRRRH
ncbi:hypothetical protein F7725_000098 [Dissostichus mawsoni]|uniref:Uncharacterized protein n=1 Tax=Dissostichus mawsoni TaxID=36200 RepID=A0A7J5ZE21_DISMA|nr:hypothetical protein F7725_000098 [Dissostichus mawsoni]